MMIFTCCFFLSELVYESYSQIMIICVAIVCLSELDVNGVPVIELKILN